MTCCTVSAVCPSLECAPCPPFFVVDIYQILVNVSLSQNLTEDEYKTIAKRCNIQEPTTTTSSTTTTSTTTATTTTVVNTQTTTVKNKATSEIPATSSGSQNISSASNITSSTDSNTGTTAYIPNSTNATGVILDTTPSKPDISVTPASTTDDTSTTDGSTTPTTSLSTGGSTRRHRWPYCNDVCLIIVITSSVCVFLVVLVALALCCRRKPPRDKRDSRSNSSQRLVANGTAERTSSIDRRGGTVWRHSPGIENLAYRKSMELREPLKYMEYEQNWQDLDYYATGSNKNIKDGSLKSDRTSQRSDSSPRRQRRSNKDRKQNSTDGFNARPGMVFIPLDERKPRSLPRIPTETQTPNDKAEYGYPNGIRFLSLPRTHIHQNGAEHRRSKSDGQNRSRSKQRPRSFDQLYHPSHNIDKGDKACNGAVKRNQKSHLNPELNHIKNILPTKDNNLKRTQDRRQNNTRHKPNNASQKPNTNNANQNPNSTSHRGLNRSSERMNRTNDDIFPTVDGSSSPKFYPPYRDSNDQNVLFTTKL